MGNKSNPTPTEREANIVDGSHNPRIMPARPGAWLSNDAHFFLPEKQKITSCFNSNAWFHHKLTPMF
jgi:hypothetical protein